MSLLTTYTVKSKAAQNVWCFKYSLKGLLVSFEILDGELTLKQINWLLDQKHFPFTELQIKAWGKMLKDNFEIVIGEPDLSFDTAWEQYGYKVGKKEAQDAWRKMSEANKVRFFLSIEPYKRYIARKQISPIYMVRYITKERYNDDYDNIK
ncbi:hypothetical protein [Flavobacterium caeni]|uniref:Uncharacterized protein n=1 Tax=Flavobacterium caeni TaxID=490189 RepID=A0A1G5K1H2_9FLAO|nr:hypothetical protein [Flavobacterium caeni]SCY94437.1 hypothetical protein SAMN02927903_03027 [Flavobacterium caeni]